MRGKVCRRDAPENRGRITPAYAGKRSTPSRFPEKQQDHPRLCGEKFQSVHRWTFFIGSPPPMRGKEFCNACKVVNFRDHPRLCGEKVKRSSVSVFLLGSPPPMRGKAWLLYHRGEFFRITPAYAGKSQHRERDSGKSEDHPRLCGEKFLTDKFSRSNVGSPPPMRGKAQSWQAASFAYGDHPRLCGEKFPQF